MSNYPNPCDKCAEREMCKTGCAEWKKRFNTVWKQFNSYERRALAKAMKENELAEERAKIVRNKFCYEHPDIVRNYLKHGPCEMCKANDTCDIPCFAYMRWWYAKVKMICEKMGVNVCR